MHNRNVLVVEDDNTVRGLLIDCLQSQAVNADGARDGVEALHLIVTRPYAVIVLDLLMPKMSGVDVLDSLEALTSEHSVKALDGLPVVLIITAIAMATLPDDSIFRRCPGSVEGIFRKPLDIEKLTACVKEHLAV